MAGASRGHHKGPSAGPTQCSRLPLLLQNDQRLTLTLFSCGGPFTFYKMFRKTAYCCCCCWCYCCYCSVAAPLKPPHQSSLPTRYSHSHIKTPPYSSVADTCSLHSQYGHIHYFLILIRYENYFFLMKDPH